MQITVYVVDTDGYLGRPSQTVTLTPGSVDVSCYEAPEGDPESKVASSALPESFSLDQNYPNPFNNQTTLTFHLTAPTEIDLAIYNVLGEKITSLAQGLCQGGSTSVPWNGTDYSGKPVASGIYFARLTSTANEATTTRKLVLLK